MSPSDRHWVEGPSDLHWDEGFPLQAGYDDDDHGGEPRYRLHPLAAEFDEAFERHYGYRPSFTEVLKAIKQGAKNPPELASLAARCQAAWRAYIR